MFISMRAALVAVCLIIAGAMPAAAQQAAPAPAPAQQEATFSLTGEQIGAIAIGAVAGAVLLRVLVGGMGHLAGAVLGGAVGYWYATSPAPTQVAQGG